METGQKLVAIIDDDQDDLDIMQHVIKTIDPTIVCVGFIYPEDAVNELLNPKQNSLPQYLFIDINMPGLRGDKCLRLFRSKSIFEDTIIVMYSTSMPENVAQNLIESGANYTFEKPVRIKTYSEILSQILQ
jgi:CheY-like chemotaxis protein